MQNQTNSVKKNAWLMRLTVTIFIMAKHSFHVSRVRTNTLTQIDVGFKENFTVFIGAAAKTL